MTIRNAVTLLAVAAVITSGQNTAIGAPPSQTVIAALLVILNSGNTLDSDGDGILDLDDAFPEDADENLDSDQDGTGDNSDLDDDNDGVLDTDDAFPLDPDESIDSDSDGLGDNADTDDDNDGVQDTEDPAPLDPNVSSNDLMVFDNGVVGATWDRGVNAFDEALNWGDCENDGGAACPSIAWQIVDQANRNNVLKVTHGDGGSEAGLFIASADPVDLTGFRDGSLQFDIRILTGDANITVKLDCVWPCSSGEQELGERGVDGWETVSVPMSRFTDGGLDITKVNTAIVVWPTAHQATQYLIDNIKWVGFDSTASPPVADVPHTLTHMGRGSYSDTIHPHSYRCVVDYGNWIYNAGIVEPGIAGCVEDTKTPVGEPVPKTPQKAGAALHRHTMTHRWWGSIPFIGEMRIGDPNGAGYITPDPLLARLSEKGARIMGLPSGLSGNAAGFGYAIPDPFSEVFDGIAVSNSAHSDMEVMLVDYSDGSVTAGWFDESTAVMEATFTYGSPYVFFEVFSGSAELRTLRSNSGEKGVWYEGGNSLGVWTNVAGNLSHFLITGDEGTTFANTGSNSIDVNTPNGEFTVAWAPDSDDTYRQILAAHARNVVKELQITYSVDESTNNVQVSHQYVDAQGMPVETLAGLMPLQWKRTQLNETEVVATARSARGVVKFISLSNFNYMMHSVGVLPSLPVIPDSLDTARLAALIQNFVSAGPTFWNSAEDTYWTGKSLARVAEVLALADQLSMTAAAEADQLSMTAAADLLRNWLKEELADWLSADNNGVLDHGNYFVYDEQWNTLLGLEESFGSHQQLNDHHFHYGYFIRAAAEVCRTDKSFCAADQYGQMLELLIRDYAGGRDDPMFPYLRNFDPANGFSWASGHANFVRGNNNESTSEAANAYGAMVLYGLVTGNDAIVDRGVYLHASTSATYWEYWNDIDGYEGSSPEARNFPPGYPRITTSIIWGDGSAFSTWFSGAFAHILGIQGLPSNPLVMHVGLYSDYLDDYVALGLSESSNGLPSGLPEGQWTDLWWNLWALTDADAAISDFEANLGYVPEAGETTAHTYHWLYTMRTLGELKTGVGTVTADYPAAMVFQSGDKLTYVAYNYNDTELVVSFSDGTSVTVAPNSFAITTP